ncbi:MAG: helix-turn-helix domain-containing protein, partial [Novosphingobium sp.]
VMLHPPATEDEDASAGAEQVELTASEQIRLEFIPPSEQLRPFVTTFYSLRCDEPEILDCLPAAVGYLTLNLAGSGILHFADGRAEPSHDAMFLTPTTAAVRIALQGPWHMIGAALSPLGWAALTGLHAGDVADRVLPASQVLGAAANNLAARIRSIADGDAARAAVLADLIGDRLRPVKPRHVQVIDAIANWLSSSFDPPVSILPQQANYSIRQVERLCERYFGVPPKQLARKYRALRVAALLQAPDTSPEQVAALKNLYFDQSHLIRDMRHYLGRTPNRIFDGSAPLLNATSSMRGYREVRPNFARIPGD